MKLQVGVKVLIKNNDSQYLFLKRRTALSTDSGDVSWDIPGGRIEPDEALLDALRREVREEIGHELAGAPKLVASQDIFVEAHDLHVVRLTYVISENITKVVLSKEHNEYRWVNVSDLASIKTEPYLSEVLLTI